MMSLPCEFRVVMRPRPASPQRVQPTTATAALGHTQFNRAAHNQGGPIDPRLSAPGGSFGHPVQNGGSLNASLTYDAPYGDAAREQQVNAPRHSLGHPPESHGHSIDLLALDAPIGAALHMQDSPFNANCGSLRPSNGSGGIEPDVPYISPHGNAAQDLQPDANGYHANGDLACDGPFGVGPQDAHQNAPGGMFGSGYPPGFIDDDANHYAAHTAGPASGIPGEPAPRHQSAYNAASDSVVPHGPAPPYQSGAQGNPPTTYGAPSQSPPYQSGSQGILPTTYGAPSQAPIQQAGVQGNPPTTNAAPAQAHVGQPAAQQPTKKLRSRWDDNEIATLERLMAIRPSLTNKEIGEIVGKTANAIYLKRSRKYRGMFKNAHKSDKNRKAGKGLGAVADPVLVEEIPAGELYENEGWQS